MEEATENGMPRALIASAIECTNCWWVRMFVHTTSSSFRFQLPCLNFASIVNAAYSRYINIHFLLFHGFHISEAPHASGILCSLAREYTTTIYDRRAVSSYLFIRSIHVLSNLVHQHPRRTPGYPQVSSRSISGNASSSFTKL